MESLERCPWCGRRLATYRLGSVERCMACRQIVASGEEGSPRHGQLPNQGCVRCGMEILRSPEFCWHCTRELCYRCWDEHGHCGAPEAEEAARKAREWKAGDPQMVAPWLR